MTDRNHLWSIKEQFTRQGLKAGDAVSEPCSRRAFILVLLSIFWESRRPSCLPSCDGSCLHHLPSHHTLRRSPGKLEVPLLPHPPGETAARAGVGAHGPEPLGAAAAPQRLVSMGPIFDLTAATILGSSTSSLRKEPGIDPSSLRGALTPEVGFIP